MMAIERDIERRLDKKKIDHRLLSTTIFEVLNIRPETDRVNFEPIRTSKSLD